MQENTFNRWGMLMQIILVKFKLYVTENAKKNAVSFTGKTPLKLKKCPQKSQTISIPYLLQAQPALVQLLFACYCISTTICRRLVVCFGFNGPLRQYFSLYRAVSRREGERGEKGQMRVKMSKQPPPAPTASAVGPCPTEKMQTEWRLCRP